MIIRVLLIQLYHTNVLVIKLSITLYNKSNFYQTTKPAKTQRMSTKTSFILNESTK